jgi:hypothetical protein
VVGSNDKNSETGVPTFKGAKGRQTLIHLIIVISLEGAKFG